MRILLVGMDPTATSVVEHGVRLAGTAEMLAAGDQQAVAVALRGEPPAAAVIAPDVEDPIRLAQSLAGIDGEMAIMLLSTPERHAELSRELRFAPLITTNTTCRSTAELEQVGVDVAQAAQAAVRRREHRASLEAATDQLRTQVEAPRLRGEALGRLVEAAPIGIVTLSPTHAIAAWNSHAAEIVGGAEADAVGRPIHELFDPAERERLVALLRQAGPPQPHSRPELFRRRRRGIEQFVEIAAGPAVTDGGDTGTLLVLSDVTERVLAERAQRRAEQAQAFLAETGALLDASLDSVETLQRIASLAVPARAELCLIDLLEEDGTIQGVAFAAVDPDVARAVEDIRRRYPVDPRGGPPVARVLRSGRAEVLEEMTEATYRRIAQSEEHAKLMRRLHYHSALVAPLAARGRMYGAISLLYLDPRRKYSPDDLSILEDVARRAALALDNARLYSRERRIAETLQRSLLPPRLPDVPGVTLAARYEPGDGDVGGDWYDVIPLPGGRLGCVVGDIVGRGIQAASVMGQLRNAVRVYALERETADGVVEALDRLSDSLGIGQMATLAYLILDPAEGTLEICSAGHPPPLIVGPDGTARYPMGGRSGPVGVGLDQTHTAASERFPAGSLLLLYTDGLIERRGASIDEGLAKLEAASSEVARRHPAEVADAIVGALRPGPHSDDVALLVVRADAVADRLRFSFPADFANVRAARAEVRRWLEGRLEESELYDVLLACSEACANSVEHAYALRRGRVEVEGDIADGELIVVVRDFGRWRPQAASQRGRGTGIMEATMDRVEVVRSSRGTEVVLRRRLASPAAA